MYLFTLAGFARHISGLIFLLLLTGCATSPQWPSSASGSNTSLLQQRVLLDKVPFYPQERYQCGPASLAMMLNSQGLSTNPQMLKDNVYIPGRKGSLQVEMVATARAHEMLVYPLDRRLESLLKEVAAGHPVLVMQNLLFDWWPQWHFSVVIGFDGQKQTLILNTDTRQHYETSVKVFSATWARANRWAVVILPPDQLPATASPLGFLAAASDLEITGYTRAAMTAYQTAEAHWPDQPAALLGQGNIAYKNNRLNKAKNSFFKMVTKFPETAEGWNNLAHILNKLNCTVKASEAQRCANALSPEQFSQHLEPAPLASEPASCDPVPACPNK